MGWIEEYKVAGNEEKTLWTTALESTVARLAILSIGLSLVIYRAKDTLL